MKQRFSALDVRATVTALQKRIVGLRLQGIYDVNPKTFLFKFTKPDCKELVLVESGIRMHTTEFTRDKSIIPSNFCMKLRKHLKARRLTGVRQIGMDRVVDFEFAVAAGAKAEGTYHILCEFYASGNVILTDYQYNILALMRVVHLEGEPAFAVGRQYSLAESRDIDPVARAQLVECLRRAGPKDTLKRTLTMLGAYGPALTEHIILRAKMSPSQRVSAAVNVDAPESLQIDALLEAYADAFSIVTRLGREVHPGFITFVPQRDSAGTERADKGDDVYDEFSPWLFDQYLQRPHTEFASFCDAADVFFSNIEAQRLKVKAHQQEQAADRKLEAIKAEHEGRVAALERAHRKTEEQARRIEMNLEFVDQAILIIRQAVAAGMDWKELEELVRDQQDQGNPVAERIIRLNLAANQITLELDDPADWDESDDSSSSASDSDGAGGAECRATQLGGPMSVEVDIFQSAFANAQRYYNSRRHAGVKHAKTLAVSAQALQSAEQKIKADLRATKVTATVTQQRKPFWFEKFSWFLSSDGFLVLAGHDMQQNELLVKRHLRSGDAYVHADLHGAASVIVKNRDLESRSAESIPPSTLFQAGIMSVCQSRAWDAKIVTSAWWVEAHQVSKSAPTGEYLSTGSFMIRGKKHFLPPTQLVYGFGFAFRLADDESVARHVAARQQRLAIMQENQRAATGATSTANLTAADNETESQAAEDSNEADQTAEFSIVGGSAPTDSAAAIDTASTASDAAKHRRPGKAAAAAAMDFGAARKKYNLEEVEQAIAAADDFANESNAAAQMPRGDNTNKRHVSAKERRDQRKQTTTQSAGASAPPATGGSTAVAAGKLTKQEQRRLEQEKKFDNHAVQNANQQQQQQQQKRGRKGKMRKMKEKYADQDDDERELKIALSAAGGKCSVGAILDTKLAKTAEASAVASVDTVEREDNNDDDDGNDDPASELDEADAADVAASDDAVADQLAALMVADNPATIAMSGAPEDIDDDDDIVDAASDQQLDVLDMLTAAPLPGDNLASAIPVCAPYSALSAYKYRVKLVPGTMKKGKACKMALTVALGAADGNKPRSTHSLDPAEAERLELALILANREKELMKVVPEPEMIAQMLGKVKVTAPNMESIRQKSKAAAKTKAKSKSKDE
ncbi:hypothetical protein LPJ66_000384 [Kickxella alabastrina]|uniref:Uncharacterized protein n=1 Tax=Kickxella alabastrina TaxID=61397 RepID=A0ACC1IWG3_9FUNG|nr:hypothetical protein LPJ66_000384 [Kickxella alabastrina]